VRRIDDRLVLDASHTQRDFQAIPSTVCGQSEGDISVYHGLCNSVLLALFRRRRVDRAKEARCVFLVVE
jgi:hypothetical protein